MSEPIYNKLLGQFVKKHGHKPGDQPIKRPVDDLLLHSLFRKLFPARSRP
jgi:hypothetical protein